MQRIFVTQKSYPVRGVFRISRSAKTQVDVVEVTLQDGDYVGRGECRPYARYGETPQSVSNDIRGLGNIVENKLSPADLQSLMPAGAARNAVDCAMWDLVAKRTGRRVYDLAGLPQPKSLKTAFTLSLDTPENMALAAIKARAFTCLKIKVGAQNAIECAKSVMRARPDAELIIDANEALQPGELMAFRQAFDGWPIVLIEQPFHADSRDVISDPDGLPVICADEALHTADDLARLWSQGYRAVNIKLDKCGGLTAGIDLVSRAQSMGFVTMAGCMVGSSLALAPMMLLAQDADVIDLDGPSLLDEDCEDGLVYDGQIVHPPSPTLWG